MPHHKPLKPGQPAPVSGQYDQLNRQGNVRKEITSTKGNRLPPGPKGTTYRIADRTRNKSGRGR